MAWGYTIGRRIYTLRAEQDLTMAELADRSAISVPTICCLEGGQIDRPRATTVKQLARALGVSVADLTGEPTAGASRRQ